MLTKYRVKNLATIVDEEIQLGRLVRISGANSAGKSMAFFDALEACLLHTKIDPDNIRWGTRQAEVFVEWDDGRKLHRTITASKQTTILTYPDGTVSKPITLFKDCQDQVQEFTKFKTVKISDGKETLSEWLQIIPLAAPQIDYIENVSPARLLKRITAVTGGGEITAAKAKVEREIRDTISQRRGAEANYNHFYDIVVNAEEATEEYRLNDSGLDVELANYTMKNGKFNPQRLIDEISILKHLRNSVTDTYAKGTADISNAKEGLERCKTLSDTIKTLQDSISSACTKMSAVDQAFEALSQGTLWIEQEMINLKTLEQELSNTADVCEKCGKPL